MRTSIYVDGFNLFYRALKGTPYKWLDIKLLSTNLLQKHNQIVEIKYFTALVSGIFVHRQPIRQKTYIRAIQSYIKELHVYYGHFLSHQVSAPKAPLTNPPISYGTILCQKHPLWVQTGPMETLVAC